MEVLVNESNLLVGIYFQDVEMKQIFSAYPELICIDTTYKLLELRFPVYIMLVKDGNGQSEIVAVFLLMEETEQSIKSMVGIFKNHNPQWEATRVLMADKDMTERNVLAAEFPSAERLICLFHTFRSFHREVVMDRMDITSGQRNMCLELLQQMAYSTNEENYHDVYTRFCECAQLLQQMAYSTNEENYHCKIPVFSRWLVKTLIPSYNNGLYIKANAILNMPHTMYLNRLQQCTSAT